MTAIAAGGTHSLAVRSDGRCGPGDATATASSATRRCCAQRAGPRQRRRRQRDTSVSDKYRRGRPLARAALGRNRRGVGPQRVCNQLHALRGGLGPVQHVRDLGGAHRTLARQQLVHGARARARRPQPLGRPRRAAPARHVGGRRGPPARGDAGRARRLAAGRAEAQSPAARHVQRLSARAPPRARVTRAAPDPRHGATRRAWIRKLRWHALGGAPASSRRAGAHAAGGSSPPASTSRSARSCSTR